jgi:hypothetical protein
VEFLHLTYKMFRVLFTFYLVHYYIVEVLILFLLINMHFMFSVNSICTQADSDF